VAWSVTFFNDRVEAEILALAPGFVARFIRYAERMELFGSTARLLTVASSFFTNL